MPSDRELIASDIEAYLRRYEDKQLLRFVAVGSVDDGKSTLIGRLLYDTGSVHLDQLDAVRRATQMAGTELDLSLLTDGLAAEREQGITIDVAYRYFNTDRRKFIIADTPGHVQYTRNMVTGASTAHVAIILIDARLGVLQQSRRHAYIASLLGIPRLAVCLNKMDLVDYSEARYLEVVATFTEFTRSLQFSGVTFFPVSALRGDNCVHRSEQTPWYDGPTVLEYLESVPVEEAGPSVALRYPVQCVLRPNLDYRGFAGRIAAGVVTKGQSITVLPSGRSSRVRAIDTYQGEVSSAQASQSVALRLEDEIDVSRGDMLVDPRDQPRVTRTFDANVVWLHDTPLDPAKTYLLKHTTQTTRVDIDRVHWRKDMDTLEEQAAKTLELNDIGRLTLTAHRTLFLDAYADSRETGSFILIETIANNTVGAGMVLGEERAGREDVPGTERSGAAAAWPSSTTAPQAVVITGSDARATELLARAVEARLGSRGVPSVVLAATSAVAVVRAARALGDAGLVAIAALPSGPLADDILARLDDERCLHVLISGDKPGRGPARVLDLDGRPEDTRAEAVVEALSAWRV